MNDESTRTLKETLDILDKSLRGSLPPVTLEHVKTYFSVNIQLAFAQGRLHGISEVGEKDAVNR